MLVQCWAKGFCVRSVEPLACSQACQPAQNFSCRCLVGVVVAAGPIVGQFFGARQLHEAGQLKGFRVLAAQSQGLLQVELGPVEVVVADATGVSGAVAVADTGVSGAVVVADVSGATGVAGTSGVVSSALDVAVTGALGASGVVAMAEEVAEAVDVTAGMFCADGRFGGSAGVVLVAEMSVVAVALTAGMFCAEG